MRVGTSALVFGLAACALSEEIKKDGHVDVLGKDTFKQWVEEHPIGLVEFYAPWCGHCKSLKPEYESAAEILLAEKVGLAKVDCTEEKDLCGEYKVEGFPTLKVLRDGEFFEYKGTRKSDGIVSYMKKQASPAIQPITAAELAEFKKEKPVVMVAFMDADSKELKTVSAVASKLRDDHYFAVISDKKAAKQHKAAYPGIVVLRDFDEPEVAFEGKFTEDAIEKFLEGSSVPVLGDINGDTYQQYSKRKLPFAYFFYEGEAMRKEMVTVAYETAKKHSDKLSFVLVDASKFSRQAEHVNLKLEWPAFAIQGFEDNSKYPFSQTDKITSSSVASFVDKFIAGEIKPSMKSQPIPEKNDGPVLEIVADNFKDSVWTGEKDVLIEMYASWCGHCKKLIPVYDRLAKAVAGNKNLIVAKMNADLNDIPPEAKDMQIKGFPTIFLVKKGSKEVLQYEGGRTYDEMIAYLKKEVDADLIVSEAAADAEKDKEPKEPKEPKASREEL